MSFFSNDFKPLRKSLSLPDLIASRHDSNVSGTTVSTGIGTVGSCSILDKISYSTMCGYHHHHNQQLHHPDHHHQLFLQSHHYAKNHRKHENLCNTRLVADLRQLMTLHQHYYPEGGWGWIVLAIGSIVQCISHGLHMSVGVLMAIVIKEFGQTSFATGLLGAFSIATGLFLSPVITAICRSKSTRLLAVIGGLIATLGCLFSSFAIQFHQIFFSYGIIVGMGVGVTRDCSTIMIAQYFKRKKELVEIVIVAGSGCGIIFMSTFFTRAIESFGWRHGMQCVSLTVLLTFFLGMFYRSASLYHPQRRAILHLKNQKRKVKEKIRRKNRMEFLHLKTLRSKTIRIILLSCCLSAFGLHLPVVVLAQHVQSVDFGEKMLTLQVVLGIAWIIGTIFFGLLVIQRSHECRIARQYLCQASLFICALCMLAFAKLSTHYEGYFIIVSVYGFFCGGYNYSLRVFVFERVRARYFSQTWSYIQLSQSIPILVGITLAEYFNEKDQIGIGFTFAFIMVLLGSVVLFLINFRKRNITRKSGSENDSRHLCMRDFYSGSGRRSFTHEAKVVEQTNTGASGTLLSSYHENADGNGDEVDSTSVVNGIIRMTISAESMLAKEKPELTCISEEKIADIDLLENVPADSKPEHNRT